MLRFSKAAFRFFLLSCLLLYIAFFVIGLFLVKNCVSTDPPLGLLTLGFLVLSILLTRSVRKMAANEYYRLLRLLDQDCDPLGYLAAHEYAYNKALKTRRGRAMPFALVERQNHAVALNDCGEHEQAIQVLEAVIAAGSKPLWQGAIVTAHTGLASVYLARDGANGVEKAREQLRLAADAVSKAEGMTVSANTQVYSSRVTYIEYVIDVLEGKNLDAALDYFKKSVSSAAPLLEQLSCRRYLAMIHEKQGHADQARAEYEIVAARANGLYIAAKAKAWLERTAENQ